VNFSFQEATYVNHNLTQSIIVPTMTIAPGSTSASAATMMAGASGVAGVGGTATQVQVSAPLSSRPVSRQQRHDIGRQQPRRWRRNEPHQQHRQ
jgi:hypothetical protein